MRRGGERWFLHELTRELGGHTVAELAEIMGSREFVAWMELYRESPWGDYRADLRAGVIAATVYNVHRTKGGPAKPGDFVLQWRSAGRRRQSSDEMYRAMRTFSRVYNATRRGRRPGPGTPLRRLE